MPDQRFEEPLPLPRLILRVGVLGNRYFGRDNGIDADPGKIHAAIRTACDDVWETIEAALLEFHSEELGKIHKRPSKPPRWKTHALPFAFLGSEDRWGQERRNGQPASVFTDERPCISVLSGDAIGADQILWETASQGSKRGVCGIDYERQRVVPEAPEAVVDGLGVGEPDPKKPELLEELHRVGYLPRSRARDHSRITKGRAHAYRAQSDALRHHSDLLIAIWDPDAEGKAGGTSESVMAALNERLPVVAISVHGENDVRIRLMREPKHVEWVHINAIEDTVDWRIDLKTTLQDILCFPDPQKESSTRSQASQHGDNPGASPTHDEKSDCAYHPRSAFATFRENKALEPLWPQRVWRCYDNFVNFRRLGHESSNKPEDSSKRQALRERVESARDRFETSVDEVFETGEPTAPTQSQDTRFDRIYGRVRRRAARNGFSGAFGDAHRGAIIVSYLLAAGAVFMAVLGAIFHKFHVWPPLQVYAALAELLFIAMMFALWITSKVEDWKTAYTDTRILAEALRWMETLAPLGVKTPLPRLPSHLTKSKRTPAAENMWTIWYFRALNRMAPLRLRTSDDKPRAPDLECIRRDLIDALEKRNGQLDYHQRNSANQSRMLHDFEKLSMLLFYVVFACAGLHFADVTFAWHSKIISTLAMIFCIGGPALIAALHGLASQLEMSRLEQRSSSMRLLLQERADALRDFDLQSAPTSAETVWGFTEEALKTTSLLIDEAASWSMLYRNTEIHAG